MHSNEMNKIEVQNVKKYPLVAVFYEIFFSIGNHSIFICSPNRMKIGKKKINQSCKIKNKIDFIRENFSVFFVVFVFENLKVNYLRELGKKYSYKSKTMKKTEKLHRRK